MAKKEDVHLKLSEELEGIDADLDKAMEALSETSQRIDAFLNQGVGGEDGSESRFVEMDEAMPQPEASTAPKSETEAVEAAD